MNSAANKNEVPELVARAAERARLAHESIDQRRKYSNAPYIVHPRAVAATVRSVTDDPITIAAAWLHDVVEDTPVTIEEIENEFGPEVAKLVDDLTDVSRLSDGNRQLRTAIDREHTAAADPRAKTVKLADVIDNLSDIAELDPKYAALYVGEKELLLEVLREGDAELYRRAEQVIKEANRILAG